MSNKPWCLLNPNDFQFMWWRTSEIVDVSVAQDTKHPKHVLAYNILQDGNMAGNFWHFSVWYICDPNRYVDIIYENQWPFNKALTDMIPGDVVYLTENPDVRFDVYYSPFGTQEQQNFCKILERKLFY